MKPPFNNSGNGNSGQEWPMRFVHRFKCGIVATAPITETGQYGVHWSRRPKLRKIEQEYLAWRETMFSKFTEATGIDVLVITY